METKWITEENLDEAVKLLREGEVVAFPTETVYGLGADATNQHAVERIYQAKERPSDNPLIVHVASIEQVENFVEVIPPKAMELMENFWPGPLTILLKVKNGSVAPTVTAGLETVGLRMPDHSLALKLIRESGRPLAAPSANLSGKPSPTEASHVKQDLTGKIAGIVDGGQTGVGLESTIIDLSEESTPIILRPGGIAIEEIENIIGKVKVDSYLSDDSQRPKAPGMKYTHYAPSQPVWIVGEEWEKAIEYFTTNGEKIGLLASEEKIARYQSEVEETFSLGKKESIYAASHFLYKGLRYFDETKVSVILAEEYPQKGIGVAYMNRLEKAAGYQYFNKK